MAEPRVTVVGGGFAGCEAAWAAANLGASVRLFEMRPGKQTPAHKTDKLAELVCSNSFKSMNPDSPAGQLKAEMEALGSLMIPVAKKHTVPGGEALAVDREAFADEMTERITAHPLIEVIREEWAASDMESPTVIATGPLTSENLSEWIARLAGREHLYFYDAVSPTVEAPTVDMSKAWEQSRYDKGDAAYINCPMDREQYDEFIDALLCAEQAPLHGFEKGKYFEGCMPIEEIAQRGRESLRFGNFKPVGLTNPHTGARAYAVLQLRPENREKTLYSMVACQNRLRWGEQKRVFQMIPGLRSAEFVRFGVIHRNTYLDSPRLIGPDCKALDGRSLFFAGQITGVEGYVESGAIGILAGMNAARLALGESLYVPPRPCAYGCLTSHITNAESPEFLPMNINWGLFPEPEPPIKDKGGRRQAKLENARKAFETWLNELSLNHGAAVLHSS
ncbi:MAG: methylenetetrahydrofolate--tRNA-(uracil(54)-C(5))-methyltransferase (FADH(2)-oxidizing) TrmFO [Fimbriimonadales bacterium]